LFYDHLSLLNTINFARSRICLSELGQSRQLEVLPVSQMIAHVGRELMLARKSANRFEWEMLLAGQACCIQLSDGGLGILVNRSREKVVVGAIVLMCLDMFVVAGEG
jgi:hypothetical protein